MGFKTGLTDLEADRLLQVHGLNVLKENEKVSPVKIFLKQFSDVLIVILMFSIIASAFLGEFVEAVTILLIIVVNAFLGFIQEYRTEKTLQALKKMASQRVRVVRDGKVREIGVEYLVPGDIVLLEAGDRVPADCRLIESNGVTVDESILTGESHNVEKIVGDGKKSGNKESWTVFMGSVITSGRGRAVVEETGMNTQMGKIASLLMEVKEEATPLQKKLAGLGKYIGIGCIVICTIVSIAGVIRGENIFTMILSGISLAVASIPEGLPAIVTISLAMGLQRMLKRNALIRRLPVVETLGCANIICSDKTGTITQNKMEVRQIKSLNSVWKNDDESKTLRDVDGETEIALKIGVVCNNVLDEYVDYLKELGKKSSSDMQKDACHYGDPLETALFKVASRAGIDIKKTRNEYRRLKEVPFDSDRKIMTVAVNRKNDNYIMCKGAPERLLIKCGYVLENGKETRMTQQNRKRITDYNEKMTNDALRVIAVAYRKIESGVDISKDIEKLENDMVFVGFIGMIDPPRQEVFQAVETCKKAGIKPIMITGDHKNTAKAIATEVGIMSKGERVISGEDIDRLSSEKFEDVVSNSTVFARVSPEHKIKIVRALRKKGNIVAMTGDGVNDAPAVKEADIGISMGISGTDVTKEASTMILMDDNFATIVSAIREGRIIYGNIRKFIRYMLSCNIGEVVTMFVGTLAGVPIPLLPIQILWVNLVTDGLPAVALGLEPGEESIMSDKPRKANDGIFSGGLLHKILLRGFLIGMATFCVYMCLLYLGKDIDVARTGAFLTLILTQLTYVFKCKTEDSKLSKIKIANNPWLVGAVLVSFVMALAVVYVPIFYGVFGTAPIGLTEWGIIVIATIIATIIL